MGRTEEELWGKNEDEGGREEDRGSGEGENIPVVL